MKRGLTQQEAMAYVGVKRRTWEALWAPRLVRMCGNSVSPLPMRLIVAANYHSDAAAVRRQA